MSLERCLLKHRDALKNPEKAEIVAAKQEYMSRGMSEHDAAVQALKDQIRAVEKQRADIVEEGMKQWKAQDPETHSAAESSPAASKVRTIPLSKDEAQFFQSVFDNPADLEELHSTVPSAKLEDGKLSVSSEDSAALEDYITDTWAANKKTYGGEGANTIPKSFGFGGDKFINKWRETSEDTPATRERKPARTLDQIVYESIEDGASAEEILTHISRQSKDEFVKSFATYLRKHVKGVKLRIGDLEKDNLNLPEEYGSDIKDRMTAIYNNLSRTVSLYVGPERYATHEIVLHELTHAASIDALESNSQYAVEMNRLLEVAREKIGKLESKKLKDGKTEERWNHYGLTNVKEFVAEVFSNPDFQQLLLNVPATTQGKVSVWTAFKDAIFRALGLGKEIRSLFDEIMDSSEGLFEDNTYLQQQEMAGLEGNVASVAPDKISEVSDGFRKIPVGTKVLATHGLKYQEPTIGTVTGSYFFRGKDKSYMLPTVDFGDGKNRKVLPEDIKEVYRPRLAKALAAANEDYASVAQPIFEKANDLIEGNTKLIDALGSLRRGKMYVQFLRDLKDNYGSLLQDSNGNSILGAYVDRAFSMAATANELLKSGGNIAERWNELKAEKQALSDLAADATVSGIHPDLPLNAQDYDASNGRKISNKTLANDEGVFPDDVQRQHAELQARYMKLSDRAKKVYKDARDHMADNWNKREALLNKRINDVYQPLIDEAAKVGNKGKVEQLTKERDEFIEEHGKTLARVSGPYFPLSRFGDYYVVKKSEKYIEAEAAAKEASDALRELYVKYDIPLGTRKDLESLNKALPRGSKIDALSPAQKEEFKAARKLVREANKRLDELVADGSHYSNEAFESEGKAKLRAAELGVDVMLKDQYFKELSPITQTFLNRIGDAVAGALPEKQALEAREAMTQIWIKSLPDTSAMRSQLRRRKVEGFSTDMLRSFSKNAQTDAHYLSRLEHMDALTAELMSMKDASKKPGVPLQGKELYAEIARRHVENMQFVDTPIANALSGISFIWQLGISPAFLLTNLSQPWMLSMPFMSGRHGIFRSSNELAKAFKQVAAAVGTSAKEAKSLFFEIDKSKFSADEQRMLNEAQRQGLLDITLEYDLSAMSKGTQDNLSRTMRIVSAVPHQVEVINRVMTALAAYRMEKQKGTHDEAVQYVIRVLDKTHIDYSATNAPSPLKPGYWGGLGKVMFQYRKYQLGMLSLLANQMKAATGGSKEAKRALLGLFAMHGALAGALGLPLMGSAIFIANMINKAFGDADEPWDAEVEFRNWLADVFGVEGGAVAAKGLPMLAGLDVSRRIGLGSIAAPIQVVRGNKKGRDLWLEMLASAAGPTLGGLMPNMADGASKIGQGDFLKGAAMMLPSAIAAPIKAYQLNEDGIKTAQGVTAVKPERIDAWDTTLQALGLNPSIVTERSAAVNAVETLKSDLKARAGQLEKAWVDARMKGDQEAVAEAKQAIDAYNEVRRKNGQPVIKPADLINAYRQRRTGEKAMSEQGVRQDKRTKALSGQGRFADVS